MSSLEKGFSASLKNEPRLRAELSAFVKVEPNIRARDFEPEPKSILALILSRSVHVTLEERSRSPSLETNLTHFLASPTHNFFFSNLPPISFAFWDSDRVRQGQIFPLDKMSVIVCFRRVWGILGCVTTQRKYAWRNFLKPNLLKAF